jgi:hypothetical protein
MSMKRRLERCRTPVVSPFRGLALDQRRPTEVPEDARESDGNPKFEMFQGRSFWTENFWDALKVRR